MKFLLSFCLLLGLGASSFAGKLQDLTLKSALQEASSQNKMLFLIMGRENCGNCQALRGMIKKNQVQVSDSKFVCADVNVDDTANRKLFQSKFKITGTTLPFVIIATPDGRQLAAHSGAASEREFNHLIASASKSAKQ